MIFYCTYFRLDFELTLVALHLKSSWNPVLRNQFIRKLNVMKLLALMVKKINYHTPTYNTLAGKRTKLQNFSVILLLILIL